MIRYICAAIIMLSGFGYFYEMVRFFGMNFQAKNEAEVICDGIRMVIYAIGLLTLAIASKPKSP